MDRKDQLAAVIVGPTASGKSAAALDLAVRAGGVVINADSMQVYRELRILTARPTPRDEARVPHRLYGTLPAVESCSAGRWLALAAEEVRAALDGGRLPILVGGTGLYVRALTEGLAAVPEVPPAARVEARRLCTELGPEGLHVLLRERDPLTAARLEPGDSQRLMRAWEVVAGTGRSLSDWQEMPKEPPLPGLRFRIAALVPPKAQSDAAIDGRFERMVEAGALDEVQALDVLGLDPALPAMKAHGVPALCAHIHGRMALDEAVRIGQRDTRRYAKRQRTWLRHQLPADGVRNDGHEISIRRWNTQYSESLIDEISTFICG